MRRPGLSVLELLVCVAILAVLIGLLLVAVAKVRVAAAAVTDKSNMRQIVLAVHNEASKANGRLPGPKGLMLASGEVFPLAAIFPSLEIQLVILDPDAKGGRNMKVPMYMSGLDPSLDDSDPFAAEIREACGPSSIAVNHLAFNQSANLNSSFLDGTSQTIAISEHYYNTRSRYNTSIYGGLVRIYPDSQDLYMGERSASFADPMTHDVMPVTTGFPPVSRASVPGVTFQARPPLPASDGRQLQSLQPTGLRVAMMDGSVRTLRPEITETAFWALVTRDAGDIATLD